jgi:hypothetical protein
VAPNSRLERSGYAGRSAWALGWPQSFLFVPLVPADVIRRMARAWDYRQPRTFLKRFPPVPSDPSEGLKRDFQSPSVALESRVEIGARACRVSVLAGKGAGGQTRRMRL